MKHEIYPVILLAQQGDKYAMETIVTENQGLIWSVVRKFSGRGVESEDLFQIGSIGLMKAVKKFDTNYDVEFSTYAVPMVVGEIRRFLRDDGIIKVSRNLKETAYKVKAAAEKFRKETGEEANLSQIAGITGLDLNDITLSLEATQPTESIYKTIHEGESNSVLLIDKIQSHETDEERIVMGVALKNAIKNLPKKERQILILRYYKEKTQTEVAKIMGVSQVQISRIEKKLLGKLRKNIS